MATSPPPDRPLLPLSEEDANRTLRVGGLVAGTTAIHLQRGGRIEDDLLVAVVIGDGFAEEIVRRWNQPLMSPRSAAEYRGEFARLPLRQPLPDSVPAARS